MRIRITDFDMVKGELVRRRPLAIKDARPRQYPRARTDTQDVLSAGDLLLEERNQFFGDRLNRG